MPPSARRPLRPCDAYAVHESHKQPLATKICAGLDVCPACAALAPTGGRPVCRKGMCEVIDVQLDPISACQTDDDCIARSDGCCDACAGGGSFIALRKDKVEDYRGMVCGKSKCAQCATSKGPKARCHPTRKHCLVVWP